MVVDNLIQDQTYFFKTEFLVNSLEFDPDRRILALSEIEIDLGLNGDEPFFQAYPNPASTEVRFFSSSPISGLKSAEVYNVKGKLCKSIEPEGGILNGFLLDISDLEGAVYLVRFQGLSEHSVKFVKIE